MNERQACGSMTDRTLARLRHTLAELTLTPERDVEPNTRLDVLIPRSERRRIWSELIASGFDVPELRRSDDIVWVAVGTVLALVDGSVSAWYIWTSVQLTLLLRRWTRFLAVNPAPGYETLREAAVSLTPFTIDDFRAGHWPREAIADKVRLVFARESGVPFDSIHDDTSIERLFSGSCSRDSNDQPGHVSGHADVGSADRA